MPGCRVPLPPSKGTAHARSKVWHRESEVFARLPRILRGSYTGVPPDSQQCRWLWQQSPSSTPGILGPLPRAEPAHGVPEAAGIIDRPPQRVAAAAWLTTGAGLSQETGVPAGSSDKDLSLLICSLTPGHRPQLHGQAQCAWLERLERTFRCRLLPDSPAPVASPAAAVAG